MKTRITNNVLILAAVFITAALTRCEPERRTFTCQPEDTECLTPKLNEDDNEKHDIPPNRTPLLNNADSGTTTKDSGAKNEDDVADREEIPPSLTPPPAEHGPVTEISIEGIGMVFTVPDGSRISLLKDEDGSNAIAHAYLYSNQNETYELRIFQKSPDQSFLDWASTHPFGDSFLSSDLGDTTDNKIAYFYLSDDYSAVPVIHAMIQTERFVYRLDWTHQLLRSFTANEMLMWLHGLATYSNYLAIPNHMRDFVSGITTNGD